MRLPRGTLTQLSQKTGIPDKLLSDYARRVRCPRPGRAQVLQDACEELGIPLTRDHWLYGDPKTIKTALKEYRKRSLSSTIGEQETQGQ